jgi:hypothetical protein
MKKTNLVIAFLFIILLASCRNDKQNNHPSTKDNMSLADTNTHATKSVATANDLVCLADLYRFVRMGNKIDTILDNKGYSIYYCKIGHFLIPTKKTALLIYNNAVELYIYKNDKPIRKDSIAFLNTDSKIEFQVTYADYNFDGQKDIYIQRTISNGWPMSRGHETRPEA